MGARSSLVAVVGLLAACGRIGFDDAARGGGGGGGDSRLADAVHDGVGDGALVDAFDPARCGGGTTAPDPVEIAGTVIYYTDFTHDYDTIPGATVTAYTYGASGINPTALGQATSDGSGNFDLELATQGIPPRLVATVAKTGYLTAFAYEDLPLTTNTIGTMAQIIDDGALGSVYDSASQTRDGSAGTLVIGAADCQQNPVAGVTFAVTPTPGSIQYPQSNGLPDAGETTLPYSTGVAYNAVPSTETRLDVFLGGVLQFQIEPITVASGETFTLVVVHIQ